MYHTTRRHSPEDTNLHNSRRENLTPHSCTVRRPESLIQNDMTLCYPHRGKQVGKHWFNVTGFCPAL
jgi:hypothetical protein